MNVTGFDCHAPVPRRSTVPVTVVVQQRCIPKWRDMDDQIVYPYLSHPRSISNSAKLVSCGPDHQDTCNVSEVVSRVKLLWTENHISQLANGKPSSICDLDLPSLRAQRHSCGVSEDSMVELLPQDLASFSPNSESKDFRASIHDFNGSHQWTVPSTLLPLDQHRLDNVPFTLTFWMNHSVNAVAGSRGRENLLCCADNEGNAICFV
ncbi:unnamed protein product [Dicrocoelium dendriticum]|nr:unnamed protein product [Dicrocoelium dendriticum]